MDRRRDRQAWRSARSHPSAHRRSIAAPRHGGGPRVPLIAAVHSRQWRRRRGRAALLARPQATRQGQPRPPRKALGRVHGRAVRFGGSATGATLLTGEGIETVLSLVTALPGIHAAAALSAGSLGAFEPPQDLALLLIARDKDVEGGHAANRSSASLCGTLHSLNRDRSLPLRFKRRPHCLRTRNPRGSDRALYCKHRVRCNGGGEAWEWENNYPVMMSHCVTRSHCANPCGVLHSAHAPLRR